MFAAPLRRSTLYCSTSVRALTHLRPSGRSSPTSTARTSSSSVLLRTSPAFCLPCSDNINHAIPAFSKRRFSSYNPLDWWRERQEGKEAEKYKERLNAMSQKEQWVVGDMLAELQEIKSSWAAKIPGVKNSKEIQMGKAMLQQVEGVVSVMGHNCTAIELKNMTLKQKLQCAVAGQTSSASIEIIVQQMKMMSLMHRVVRKRFLEGKPIPTNSDTLQVLLQTDGIKMMTKDERRALAAKQSKQMTKGLNLKQRPRSGKMG